MSVQDINCQKNLSRKHQINHSDSRFCIITTHGVLPAKLRNIIVSVTLSVLNSGVTMKILEEVASGTVTTI